MTDNENFLARWSRRKRGLVQERDGQQARERDEEQGNSTPGEASTCPAVPPELPSVESITASSTVGDFLKTGVPAELARVALRRAWSVDPAIRDFVGLSENSWDFNAPDGVPGFGSLSLDEARELVGQLLDIDRKPPETIVEAQAGAEAGAQAETSPAQPPHAEVIAQPPPLTPLQSEQDCNPGGNPCAGHPARAQNHVENSQFSRYRHGSALRK